MEFSFRFRYEDRNLHFRKSTLGKGKFWEEKIGSSDVGMMGMTIAVFGLVIKSSSVISYSILIYSYYSLLFKIYSRKPLLVSAGLVLSFISGIASISTA